MSTDLFNCWQWSIGHTLCRTVIGGRGINVIMLGTWQEGLKALRNSGAYLEGVGNFKVLGNR